MRAPLPAFTSLLLATAIAATLFCGLMAARPRQVAMPAVDSASALTTPQPIPAPEAIRPPNVADPAWAHPLFFQGRTPRAARMDSGGGNAGMPASAGFDAVLTGILHSPAINVASLRLSSGKLVRVPLGGAVPDAEGWRLAVLGKRLAVFKQQDQEVVLKLDPRMAQGGVAMAAAPVPPPAPPISAANAATNATLSPTASMSDAERAAAAVSAASTSPSASSAHVAPPPSPPVSVSPAMTEQQQVEAVRRRIEEARKRLRQPTNPTNPI